MIGVFGHYIDKHQQQQNRLLALQRQSGAHSGENIAKTLRKVIDEWGLHMERAVIVSDNAANNDTTLEALFEELDLLMDEDEVKARRIRCFGDVLNLIAKAFLSGFDADAFDEVDVGNAEADFQQWRKNSPVAKLHNVVKYIRSSPQRSEVLKDVATQLEAEFNFEDSTADLEVINNNETRWNSTYLMIERAMRKQRDLVGFLAQEAHGGNSLPHEYRLEANDWKLLSEIMHILEPLYELTMQTQGNGKGGTLGKLWQVLTGMEYLLEHLEDWKQHYDLITIETIASSQAQGHLEQPVDDSILNPSSSANRRGGRPVRSRKLPARLEGYEVNRTSSRPQQSQQSPFNEDALRNLPASVQDEYTRPWAREVSEREGMAADERLYISASIQCAWAKLNAYYTKLADSPLFAASVILHPEYSLTYLEDVWAADFQLQWIHDAKRDLRVHLERWYTSDHAKLAQQPKPSAPRGPKSEKSRWKGWLDARRRRMLEQQEQPDTLLGELDTYYKAKVEATDDPIGWWCKHKSEYAALSQLAIDILAIPAMAADCERVFSLSKLAMTSQRQSMHPETLEFLQCLKNWSRTRGIRLGNLLADPITKEFAGDFGDLE
ncbi:hypothetical protein VD0002_g9711 [Verticillium dahliae]|uniref:HAT C-terminal dimerisation domain-containing protein n=1 Tax=Verticillium dahliae TaxID=27337 RepID=A0AA44W941_VERDA|nr:hypothetical protein VdG2_08633 [Verticillium dahliae VDG2]PNH26277.1 hypothetical protein BJF96_g10406 [Verticillium dahliae]PNH41676.1 hypothetical protein VD0003_g9931 [Verticillium dahliae]PNH57294.1 hypothetical protein VD0002_g9711 [Verticillium dahliae]